YRWSLSSSVHLQQPVSKTRCSLMVGSSSGARRTGWPPCRGSRARGRAGRAVESARSSALQPRALGFEPRLHGALDEGGEGVELLEHAQEIAGALGEP